MIPPIGPPKHVQPSLSNTKPNQMAGSIISKTLAMAEPMLKPFRRVTVSQACPTDTTKAYITNVGDTVTSEMPVPVLIGYSTNVINSVGGPLVGDQAIALDIPDQGTVLLATMYAGPPSSVPTVPLPTAVAIHQGASPGAQYDPPAPVLTGSDTSGSISFGTAAFPSTVQYGQVTVTLGTPVSPTNFAVTLMPNNAITANWAGLNPYITLTTVNGKITAWTINAKGNLPASEPNTYYAYLYTTAH